MYNSPTLVALRDHLARGPSLRSTTLRDEVIAAVDHLTAMGCPPEQVLLALTRIADDAGLRPSPNVFARQRPLSEGDLILVRIVRWVLEACPSVDDARLVGRLGSQSLARNLVECLSHETVPSDAFYRDHEGCPPAE